MNGRCTPPNPGCSKKKTCPLGSDCISGHCFPICKSNDDCPDGRKCSSGICDQILCLNLGLDDQRFQAASTTEFDKLKLPLNTTKGYSRISDCPSGFICINGVCQIGRIKTCHILT